MTTVLFGNTENFAVMAGTALRLGLSGLLLVSAAGKAWDMPGTRQAVSEFGVPPARARLASRLLIAAEIFIALLLLLDPLVKLGAFFSGLLFLVFTLGMARVLRQGRRPDCHCFGQLHSAPVGPRVLIRNSLLVVGSFYVVGHTGLPLTSSLLSALATYLGAACVGLAGSHLAMWKSFKTQAPSHLKLGQLAPHLELQGKDGQKVALHDQVSSDRQNLLVFSSANCSACKQLKPDLLQWKTTLQGKVQFVILEVNAEDSQEDWAEGAWQVDSGALTTFKIQGTPAALLLDREGRVAASQSAVGAEEIVAMIRGALAD